ncbi:hypothetical protein JTB14_017490 [Gonioctena quinquepunctata]|nr:hypothetical protein JTB14_017490 [Gonioctena quinquepunctata]
MRTIEKTAIPIKPATSNEKTIPQRKDNNLAKNKQTAATSSTSNKPTYSDSVAGSSKNTIITNKQLSTSDERKPKPGESEEWQKIQRSKPRRQVVIGNNTSIQMNGRHMKGVPKFIDLHVSRVDPSMSAEDLKEFVKLNFPEGQFSALRSKYPNEYSSFKPKCLKQAEIIPIFKAGKNKTKIDSSCPMSLLSTVAKVIDKILLERFVELEERMKLIPEELSKFRKGGSTTSQVA